MDRGAHQLEVDVEEKSQQDPEEVQSPEGDEKPGDLLGEGHVPDQVAAYVTAVQTQVVDLVQVDDRETPRGGHTSQELLETQLEDIHRVSNQTQADQVEEYGRHDDPPGLLHALVARPSPATVHEHDSEETSERRDDHRHVEDQVAVDRRELGVNCSDVVRSAQRVCVVGCEGQIGVEDTVELRGDHGEPERVTVCVAEHDTAHEEQDLQDLPQRGDVTLVPVL